MRTELLSRVERMCNTKLNGKNLVRGINEHALSLINYYVGVLPIDPTEYEALDHEVRQILLKHHVHYQPACKERLYLPRDELGRGLQNLSHKSEQMLLNLHNTLSESVGVSTRRAAILRVETESKSHMSLIREFLKAQYSTDELITRENLMESQKASLYSKINTKVLYKKLYRASENSMVSIKDSSVWLKRGNIKPREEAALCSFQDRNVFLEQMINAHIVQRQ